LPQVTKSFLVPLDANADVVASKLLFDEFIDGVKNKTTRDRFYKAPFWPKTFWINFPPPPV
jgi:hypothetical protein